jgi:hypothetical protein
MIRIVAENIFLFLLPTIIYVAYVYMTRDQKQGPARILDDAPIIRLFIAGVVIVVVTLATFGSVTGGKPGQTYVPPSFKDGHIEPGHIE